LRLSKLEIFGFKSFAQKTVINFNHGITSIVGPNGCGKTNIVDAIRWCLGEQRSGTLRSDKMENVIFNGTSSKKPMGMAEVSLTIENDKGILPTEYSEVTITRRIFRSGESEYLLNKNICRLKDITNLFMDTGIGANAYSVIELKMVETILSNKADERRTMFEEAAGVNKYKYRRRLALRKLDEVKNDLSRVNDIVSEVEKKVNSLHRQAKKAERYTNISATLRELEIDFSEREFALFSKQKEELLVRKDSNFKRRLSIESEISKLSDELVDIKSSMNEIEQSLQGKRNEITAVTEKIYISQKQLSVAEERRNSLEDNIDRYHQELEDLNSQVRETENFIEESKKKIDDFSDLIEAKQNENVEAERKVLLAKEGLEKKRNELNSKNEELLDKFKELTNKENEFSNIEKSLAEKTKIIEERNGKILELTNKIAKTVGFIENLQNEKEQARKNLEEAEAEYLKEQERKDNLESKLNKLKNEELDRKSLINSMKDKITFIQSLIDNLDGVSKGTKALINDKSWSNKEKNLLAQIGTSDDKYRFAIEAALRNNLNNILIESVGELKEAINYLKNNSAGRAAFYLSNFGNNGKEDFWGKLNNFAVKRRIKKISSAPGFVGWAKNYVTTDKKWKGLFDRILKNTAVVESLENMLEMSNKFSGFSFVSLDGDYIDASGLVESGSLPQADNTLFGRMQLLEDLKKDFPVEEQKLIEISKNVEETENELNSIDLKILSDKGRMLVNDLANVDKQISQFEFEKKKADDEIEVARKEIQIMAQNSNKLDQQKIELQKIIESQKEAKAVEEESKQNLENEFKECENRYNSALGEHNNIKIELEKLLAERKNVENAIGRAQAALDTLDNNIVKKESAISSAASEKSSLYNVIDQSQRTADENEVVKSKLQEEEAEIYAKYKSIQSVISEKESKQNNLRKEREILTEEIHKSDLRLNEIEMKIENLKEHIKENYSLTLEKKEFDDLDSFDFNARENEIITLKQRIKNLGPINLLAYSEYEEEKERYDFLNNQRNDLIESEKDVIKTIEEINISAQKLFSDTFEKIRENFIKVFGALFNPGDEADLKMEEGEDPLEAKIEIIAKPKGKRPTSIELLSGGEKTLTAIALLFSIYLVKPSPFCILDEIDAPLDDANIDRFNKILDDFSKSTQFIVVTHNKRTMEAANTLYGVTMQEEGISKLVSVRFNEDFELTPN